MPPIVPPAIAPIGGRFLFEGDAAAELLEVELLWAVLVWPAIVPEGTDDDGVGAGDEEFVMIK